MIEAFKLDVTGDEMAKMLAGKAAYHRQRAAQQAEELPQLRRIIESLKVPAYQRDGMPGITYGNSQYANQDPVADLEQRIAKHNGDALRLDFYSKHMVATEVYRLTPHELAPLGLDDGQWLLAFGAVLR